MNAFTTALDCTSESIAICDRAGIIVYANAASETLFSRTNLVGQRVLGLFTSEPCMFRRVLRELRDHGRWQGNLRIAHARSRSDAYVTVRAVGASAARATYFCLTARPARATSDSLALSAVGRVAGEIAHDFNNQIAVVLNYTFILLRQLPEESPLRAHVSEMQGAAWRASQVAQELLGFAGQRVSECDDLDLNALLREMHGLFAFALRGPTKIEQQLTDNLLRVRGRRAHLEWLLIELTARMRATLGPIDCFRISTSNASGTGAPDAADQRAVLINVEARPRAGDPRTSPELGACSIEVGARGMRAAELALARAHGEVALQHAPEGGLRYSIRLPTA